MSATVALLVGIVAGVLIATAVLGLWLAVAVAKIGDDE